MNEKNTQANKKGIKVTAIIAGVAIITGVFCGACAGKVSQDAKETAAAEAFLAENATAEEVSAEAYDYASQMELVKQYLDDESEDGVAQDYAKASELAQEMIAQGYAEGYYIEAEIAFNEQNYEVAFENYNKALDGMDEDILGEVMCMIGYCYANGKGVEVDYAKAM